MSRHEREYRRERRGDDGGWGYRPVGRGDGPDGLGRERRAMTPTAFKLRSPSGGREPITGGISMSPTKWRSDKEWLDAAPPGTLRYAFPGAPEQVREARKVVEELF